MNFFYKHKASLWLFLKLLIGFCLFYFLYQAFFKQFKSFDFEGFWLRFYRFPNLFYLIMVLFLMPINWSIEALKWKMLLKEIEILNFKKAFASILAGISVSSFTPNRVGQFAGRILLLQNKNRMAGTLKSIVGNLAQLTATLFFGLLGLIFYLNEIALLKYYHLILILLLLVLGLFFYFNLNFFTQYIPQKWFFSQQIEHLQAIQFTKKKILVKAFLFSSLRYFVFTFQYFLLLIFFDVEIAFGLAYPLIACVFLFQSIIPSLAITELPIRGSVALYLFNSYSENVLGIVSAPSLLWLFNLVFPAILGYLVILKTK